MPEPAKPIAPKAETPPPADPKAAETPKPEEQTPPAETPAAEAPTGQADHDQFISILHSELGVSREDGKFVRGAKKKPKEKEEKPAEPPPPAQPPAEPPKPAETPAPAPIEVESDKEEEAKLNKRLEEVVDKAIDRRTPKPEPKPEPAQSPAPDPDAAFIESLDEDSKYEIELARFAESKGQKGRVKETVKFLKAVTDYFEKHQGEEGRTFDDDDEEYQKFLRQNRPKVNPAGRRRTEVAYAANIAASEAETRVRKELAPQLEAAELRTREQEVKPVIAQSLKTFREGLLAIEADPASPLKEAVELVKQKGEAAVDDDPVYGNIVLREVNFAQSAAAEYLALANGLNRFDPVAKPMHKYLSDFMENQGRYFAEHGGDQRVRVLSNGTKQTFLTRLEYAQAAAKDPEKTQREHFTFSDGDVLDMLSINAKGLIKQNVETAQAKLTKAGYGRQKPSAEPAKPPKPAEPPPKPAPTPTPAPKPAPQPENKAEEDDVQPSPRLGGSLQPGAGKNGEITSDRVFSDDDLTVLLGRKK